MTDPLIKSRQRVRDLAEVYTPEAEIKAMLDFVKDQFPTLRSPLRRIDATFLEPACGNGNFIEAIIHRKLHYVKPDPDNLPEYEYLLLRGVASVYGVDIDDDNVFDTQERVTRYMKDKSSRELGGFILSPAFSEALKVILASNIIRANTLTEAPNIPFVEYKPVGEGYFIRSWSHALVPDAAEYKRDSRPVHYSELIDHQDAA